MRGAIAGKCVANRTLLALHVIRQNVTTRRSLFEVGDLRIAKRSEIRAKRFGSWLRIDLPATFGHFAKETSVEVRIFFCRMIVIVTVLVLVSVECVEADSWRAVGLLVAVNWITIEGIRDRQAIADHFLQMNWSDVIVVVIGPPVTTVTKITRNSPRAPWF